MMRDIPVFTTENGVASLVLKKVPFTGDAYVHIQDSLSCGALEKECVDICRMAGAQRVYATGHDDLRDKPLHCSVLCYNILKSQLSESKAIALSVSLEQKDWWRQLYNRKMSGVPSSAPLTDSDAERLIAERKAFCVYLDCALLGIGVAYDDRIHAVISIVPGGGKNVVLALGRMLNTDTISLSVASTNEKAIRLYEALGFKYRSTEMTWYQIF